MTREMGGSWQFKVPRPQRPAGLEPRKPLVLIRARRDERLTKVASALRVRLLFPESFADANSRTPFGSQAFVAFCVCGAAAAPAGQPVHILKQVNRQNEDGSYSYGYENADGTYKIETKYPTGEVYGKYGYVDETGKLRTVEYGASARGFEPSGTGITVPPPVPSGGESNDLHRDRAYASASSQDDYDDGQYHEDPSIYYRSD